ncbi:hypothetical protein KYB31_20185 [Clostridium felsineum]|uniref:hypothetical protein n=1 Tax=Clostridium felsineum TaxID=36839 RepID=UPI00214D56EE|nr:hypothetical protein [Clostridium felsineum]MCR3761299.1 hypothetical protein [Clostridium felsineum]
MYGKRMELLVKLLTIPFNEIEFYKRDYLEEIYKMKDSKKALNYKKKELLPKIYEILNKKQIIQNIDEVNLMVEKFFLDKIECRQHNINYIYMYLLRELSEIFLTHRNGKICLKYWSSNDESEFLNPYKDISKIAFWNSLNRVFTTDLIVIVYFLNNEMNDKLYLNSYHSIVSVDDLQLEQILSKGMAETHMHFGAGSNFVQAWQHLMTFKKKKERVYQLEYAKILGRNFDIENYIKVASIARYFIAKYLNQNEYENFEKYMVNEDVSIKYILNYFYEGKDFKDIDINKCIEELKLKYNIYEKYDENDNWSYIFANEDVLFSVFNLRKDIKTTVENIFLMESLKYMCKNNDNYFNKIFWQYIRIKNEVFSIKVQSNTIKGLENFQDYYSQSTIYDYTNKAHIGLILHNQLFSGYLKKLEVRLSIKDQGNIRKTKRKVVDNLIEFFEVYIQILKDDLNFKNIKFTPQIGIVYHFIKREDVDYCDKCWFDYDGREQRRIYYKKIQKQYINQIEIINELREKVNGLSNYIVGIDAASIENNTEPWVFAPVYEKARDSKNKTIYKDNSRIRNLGFTFHAGEDFRHIVTGIRRIDECVEHLKFHAGDRIGHAIALGVDVDRWIKNNNVVILPRIEYMENLLWIWGLYKENKNLYQFDISYIERKILESAKKIYTNTEGITVYNLYSSYIEKFKEFDVKDKEQYGEDDKLDKNLFCLHVKEKETNIWSAEKLKLTYNCVCYLERMFELIQVEVKREDADMIRAIQKIVSRRLSSEGIIVETNPSSNTAIGEIENLFEHYICNLNKRGLEEGHDLEKAVMVTINTDDPSVFNTNLVNEYGYIYYILLEKGYAREDILMWIDSIREIAINSSFIETRQITRKELICELCLIVQKLKEYYT